MIKHKHDTKHGLRLFTSRSLQCRHGSAVLFAPQRVHGSRNELQRVGEQYRRQWLGRNPPGQYYFNFVYQQLVTLSNVVTGIYPWAETVHRPLYRSPSTMLLLKCARLFFVGGIVALLLFLPLLPQCSISICFMLGFYDCLGLLQNNTRREISTTVVTY